jgi:hypothetical protein
MDRTPISFGAWLGIVLLFLFFGGFVLVLIGLSPRGDNYEAKRAQQRREILKKVQDQANTELHSYAWVDKNKGVARIPINRAMELTVTALAQKAPAPANPIETSAAATQQSPGALPGASASPGQSPAVGTSPQSPAPQTGAWQPSAAPTAPSPSGTPKPKAVQGKDSENRNQPAAASNPPGAQPGTQPGASAGPAAAPAPPSGQPAVSPSGTPKQSPPGTPLPVPGKTP